MLPKVHRLHRSNDIVSVVRHGSKIVTPYVIIHLRVADAGMTHSRIACVVGKKVSPSAVVRHRYQRLLRSVAAEYILSIKGVYDMVWVGRSTLTNIKWRRDLEASIKACAAKLPL